MSTAARGREAWQGREGGKGGKETLPQRCRRRTL